jgi:hypothetical protein
MARPLGACFHLARIIDCGVASCRYRVQPGHGAGTMRSCCR